MNPFTIQKYKKKVVLMQRFTYSKTTVIVLCIEVYWVFLALKVLCMHEIHEFFNKITIIIDLSSLSQRLDVRELVFFLSNKKIKCLKSNLCWFIRIYIYICTLYMYINNLLNSVTFVLLLNKPIAS